MVVNVIYVRELREGEEEKFLKEVTALNQCESVSVEYIGKKKDAYCIRIAAPNQRALNQVRRRIDTLAIDCGGKTTLR